MSWFDLSERRLQKPDGDMTRIAVEKAGIRISFARSVAAKLGWVEGARLTILVGEGSDLGAIRVVPARSEAKGWRLIPISGGGGKGHGVAIKFRATQAGLPALPGIPDRLSSTAVETKFVDTGIEFRLPWPVEVAASALDRETHIGDGRETRRETTARVQPIPGEDLSGKAREAPGTYMEDGALGKAGAVGVQPAGPQQKAAEERDAPETLGGHPGSESGGAQAGGNGSALSQRAPEVAPRRPAPPPEPKPFPVQERSLAEVGKAGFGVTNDPATWPVVTRARFIEAARRGEPGKMLAEICRRPLGSINFIITRDLPEIAAERRAAIRDRLELEARPAREPERVTQQPAVMVEPEPVPLLSDAVLKFVREEIAPVLAPMGRKVTKTADGTGFLLDGKPVTVEALIDEVKEILGDDAEDLHVPDAAD